jgi:hypothetical protein
MILPTDLNAIASITSLAALIATSLNAGRMLTENWDAIGMMDMQIVLLIPAEIVCAFAKRVGEEKDVLLLITCVHPLLVMERTGDALKESASAERVILLHPLLIP